MFYKATVQAVLLFGAETWNVTPTMLAQLEEFQIRSAYQMVQQHTPERNTGGWTYPSSEDVLEEAGLYNMDHHLQVRGDTIAA